MSDTPRTPRPKFGPVPIAACPDECCATVPPAAPISLRERTERRRLVVRAQMLEVQRRWLAVRRGLTAAVSFEQAADLRDQLDALTDEADAAQAAYESAAQVANDAAIIANKEWEARFADELTAASEVSS